MKEKHGDNRSKVSKSFSVEMGMYMLDFSALEVPIDHLERTRSNENSLTHTYV